MNSLLKTFCFAKEIVKQDNSLVMGSLDVDFLFTNIPLDKTIDTLWLDWTKFHREIVIF